MLSIFLLDILTLLYYHSINIKGDDKKW